MRDHRKLRAFQLADELVLAVYKATKDFPREEVFGLTSQMRRSALSIPSNIVEGCAKETQADYLRFLSIALGSAREIEYQISVAIRLNYIFGDSAQHLSELVGETNKVLTGLIKSLRSRSGSS